MPRIYVDLSDKEYEILNNLKIVEGEEGEKLRNLFRFYLFTLPQLKSSYYALKRTENKEEIEEILKNVLAEYKNTEYPIENWTEDKINKLGSELIEINVLLKVSGKKFVPSAQFRDLFKTLLHDIATESENMDENTASFIAIIQLLKEFGAGTLSKESIRDMAIFIHEGWLFVYPEAMKEAREFIKTKKIFIHEDKIGTEIAEFMG